MTFFSVSPRVGGFSVGHMLLMMGLGLSCAPQALADNVQKGMEGVPVLAPVVVSAAGYQQTVREAPASISIVSREELEKKPYRSVQDAVRDLIGVSVVGATANKQDISIRGMPGKYTLFLVDGKRQGTREMLNREELGMVQASQLPPLSAIERIEVVRGPMSSLYGSDAIGGVINIITRKVPNQWGVTVNADTVLQQHTELGNYRGANFYVAGPVMNGKLGLTLYGKSRHRSEAEVLDGGFWMRDQGLTAKGDLKLTEHQTMEFEAGRQAFRFRGAPGKSLGSGPRDVPFHRKTTRTHAVISHYGEWENMSTEVDLYQETGKAHNTTSGQPYNSYPDTKQINSIVDGKIIRFLARQRLTIGGQGKESRLRGTNKEGANTVTGLKSRSWALFVEDVFTVNNELELTGGLRLNHHDKYGVHWSPRIYAVYSFDDRWSVRGGVAGGFRAPELRQSSAAYQQATGGPPGAPKGTIAGNPKLKPEKSTSGEIGIRYDRDNGLHASLTFFRNDFRDKIFSKCVATCTPGATSAIYEWGNLGKARIQGAELGLQWPMLEQVQLSTNYTYTQAKRLSDEEVAFDGTSLKGKPLDRMPRHKLDIRAEWAPLDRFSTFAAMHLQSAQYWSNLRNGATSTRRRPGATTYDLGGAYTLNDHISFKLSILNITDKRVAVDLRDRFDGLSGNWQVDDGRQLWLSTEVSF